MKDILIVVSPASTHHQSVCKAMKPEAEKDGTRARLFLETAILLSGPRSFETSMLLLRIAEKESLPIALFEIESVLTPSKEQGAKV
jgi:hypothetical protein